MTDSKKKFVRNMFDDIYHRYDFLNTVLSFGADRYWRKRAVLNMPDHGMVIDLCGGGGQLSRMLFKKSDFAGTVIVADISLNMMKRSKDDILKKYRGRFDMVVCDVENLPFKDEVFSGGMSAFGLRNLTDLRRFSEQLKSCLKEKGVAVHLEISHPKNSILEKIFKLYFYKISPRIASIFSGKKYAYKYLPNSLEIFPIQNEISGILNSGWNKSAFIELMGGISTIYILEK